MRTCLLPFLLIAALRLAAQSPCQPAGLSPNNQSISQGMVGFESISSVATGASFTVSGSASVTFIAGSAICLGPGFRAIAGSAPTTFLAQIALPLQFLSASPLPGGSIGAPYSYTFTATGGVAPYSYSWCSYPILGLTLSSAGLLSGSPSTPSYNYTIGIAATDSAGFTLCGQFTLNIGHGGQPSVSCSPSPGAPVVGQAVTFYANPSAGVPPYTYSWSGAVSGSNSSAAFTPQNAQLYTAGISITDYSGHYASNSCQVNVQNYPLTITSVSPLPAGLVSAPYSTTVTATGGTPPYTWSLASGSLPAGLTLSSTAGQISGTPTAAGGYDFQLQVTDNHSTIIKSPIHIGVDSTPPSFTTPVVLSAATAGSPYSVNFGATGGTSPYGWMLFASSPPPGLSLSTSGALSGTPTTPGPYRFDVQMTDAVGYKLHQFFNLEVLPATATGISPSRLETNIGPFPVDKYCRNAPSCQNNDGNGNPIIFSDQCTLTMYVPDCYAILFKNGSDNWASQQVTGVRFFFTMAGGFYSTPFADYTSSGVVGTPNPAVQQTWAANLGAFFNDLKNWGISHVTPTPVFDIWSGPYLQPGSQLTPAITSDCTFGNGGSPAPSNLYFVPWLPYGLVPDTSTPPNYFPSTLCGNNTYFNSVANPIFWGWQRFFNVVSSVLSEASSASLGITDLDYVQETSMAVFTVQARMIFDNTANNGAGTDVLAALRSLMIGSSLNPGVVTSSTIPSMPASQASSDCLSVYGDSAILMSLSALTAAVAGPSAVGPNGMIGLPANPTTSTGLYCGGTTTQNGPMIQLPVGHYEAMTVTDAHTGGVYLSGVASDTTTYFQNLYSDVWTFLQSHGQTGNSVVFGETNPVDDAGCQQLNSPAWTYQQTDAMISGYRTSTLHSSDASSVVFRPWHAATFANETCTPSPTVINPPYNPSAP